MLKWMGGGKNENGTAGSTINDTLDVSEVAEVDRFYGMENFGNTCYANSVLQALYFVRPLRECIITYPSLSLPYVPEPSPGNKASAAEMMNVITLPSQLPPAPAMPNPQQNAMSPPPKLSRWSSAFKDSSKDKQNHLPLLSPATPALPTPPVPTPATRSHVPDSLFDALQHLYRHISQIPPGPPPVALAAPPTPNASSSATHGQQQQHHPGPTTVTVVAPHAFVTELKRGNEMFRGTMQQDAHEFLNYLLNALAEDLEKIEKAKAIETMKENAAKESVQPQGGNDSGQRRKGSGAFLSKLPPTFIQKLFQGTLTNETRCLSCETVSSRDESFLDLSIDIEQNTSITACLKAFSASETLCQRNKFYCDTCCALQEAEKRMKIRTLPNVLALHLKRFKYQEDLQRYVKLSYRVVFPFQLRLFNTSDNTENPDRLYELVSIVVHVGGGPHHGHYIALSRTSAGWMMFDDEVVSPIEETDIQRFFGDGGNGSGYVLFYQACDLEEASIGLTRRPTPVPASVSVPTGSLTVPTRLMDNYIPSSTSNASVPSTLDSATRLPRSDSVPNSVNPTPLTSAAPSPQLTPHGEVPPPVLSVSKSSNSLIRGKAEKLVSVPPVLASIPSGTMSMPSSPMVSQLGNERPSSEKGGWFNRRSATVKEKLDSSRRLSGSASWYGGSPSTSHSAAPPSSISGVMVADMTAASQLATPSTSVPTSQNSSPMMEEHYRRERQPSAPGHLERRSAANTNVKEDERNGLGLVVDKPLVEHQDRDGAESVTSSSADARSARSSSRRSSDYQGLSSSMMSTGSAGRASAAVGRTPPLSSQPALSSSSASPVVIKTKKELKDEKEEKKRLEKERDKAEKEREKQEKERRKLLGRKVSLSGNGNISEGWGGGMLGGLGRKPSAALKVVGIGKKD